MQQKCRKAPENRLFREKTEAAGPPYHSLELVSLVKLTNFSCCAKALEGFAGLSDLLVDLPGHISPDFDALRRVFLGHQLPFFADQLDDTCLVEGVKALHIDLVSSEHFPPARQSVQKALLQSSRRF